MPGGRERNILRWELRAQLLRDQIARLDEQLARAGGADTPTQRGRHDELLARRAELARQLDILGPDPRAKMG